MAKYFVAWDEGVNRVAPVVVDHVQVGVADCHVGCLRGEREWEACFALTTREGSRGDREHGGGGLSSNLHVGFWA